MTQETKDSISVILELLRNNNKNNGVSMALTKEDGGKIIFFDTETYIKEKRFDGFAVSLTELV